MARWTTRRNSNFNGTDTVTYTISDGNGGTDTATVSITVNAVNDGPVALDDTASVDEDSSVVIGVLANDSDLDGDALSVTSASAGNGSVSIRPDGSLRLHTKYELQWHRHGHLHHL